MNFMKDSLFFFKNRNTLKYKIQIPGYNPFIADRFVSGGPDPGIRHQIFESTYIDEFGTPLIYGNIKWADDIHCSVDSTATVARNSEEMELQQSKHFSFRYLTLL